MKNEMQDAFDEEKKYRTKLPSNFYRTVLELLNQGLMAPTYLSRLVMLIILPSQFLYKNDNPLKNDTNNNISQDSFLERSTVILKQMGEEITQGLFEYYDNKSKSINEIYTFKKVPVDGLETIEVNSELADEHMIFFAGNCMDSMFYDNILDRIYQNLPKKYNYIFWNYPGVGCSEGSVSSVDDLIAAGYVQVKRLIDKNILAKKITLEGYSLGGGVATHVARRLHDEGYQVNLIIDRSFSRLAPVIPEHLREEIPYYLAPLATSALAFALSGIALGTTVAGFIASVGLMSASLLKDVVMAILFVTGFFSKSMADTIQINFETAAYLFAYMLNLLGSLLGGIIAIIGLVSGAIAGLIFGALLSIQLLWTNDPLTIPMTPAFSMALYSSCCEMDSVKQIDGILRNEPSSDITVLNVIDDEVIGVDASLNKALGADPYNSSSDEKLLKSKITSIWYMCGGHGGEKEEPLSNEVVKQIRT